MPIGISWSFFHCSSFGIAIWKGSFKRGTLALKTGHFGALLVLSTLEETSIFLQAGKLVLPYYEHESHTLCLLMLDLDVVIC